MLFWSLIALAAAALLLGAVILTIRHLTKQPTR
jgi:hypothetical protein